jgi:tetratricopeptide (TPR) repeat protein
MQKMKYVFLLLIISAIGCNTAQKNLDRGSNLENKGQYYDAALRYITALEKDATLSSARDGLMSAGSSALGQLLSDAIQARSARDYRRVSDIFAKGEDMRDKAYRLGVTLNPPSNYVSMRQDMFDEAFNSYMRTSDEAMNQRKFENAENALNEALKFNPTNDQQQRANRQRDEIYDLWSSALMEEGRRHEENRRWEAAFKAYDKASQKAPTDKMQRDMKDASVNMLVQWGEDDMRYNRYKGAYDRASRALQLAPGLSAAERIMRESVDRGTVQVAMLPLWRTAAAAPDMPNDFMAETNDALQYDFWDKPPMFIKTADPREVRSIMRRENLNERILSDDRVYDMGRRMNANLVMYGEITRYNVTDDIRSERERTAKTRTGQEVKYKEQTIRRRVDTQVDFRVVEPSRRRQFCGGKIDHGDINNLDLGRTERRIFDELDKREALERLMRDLTNNLSRKVATQVYDEIIHEIQ